MSESSAYRHGFDAALRDVRTGSMTLICGPGDSALVRGYQAGRRWALAHPEPQRKKERQREREAELEMEI
jgi:hypothetical protein